MTAHDEALRALEKVSAEMRARRVNHGKSESPALVAWANQIDSALAAILATASEQAPNGKLVGWWNGITPGYDGLGIPSIRWGADTENSGHDIPLYDGYNPIHYVTPPTSPAHTSEARDSERLDFMVNRGANIDCYKGAWTEETVYRVTAFGSLLTDWCPSYREAIDAAMRQEAGSRE